MTYYYGLEKSPDNLNDYLKRMFQKNEYSRAETPTKTVYVNYPLYRYSH